MPTNGGAAARAPKRAAKKAAETSVTEETAKEGVEGEEQTEGEQPKKRKARKAVSQESSYQQRLVTSVVLSLSICSANLVDPVLLAPMPKLKKLEMLLNNLLPRTTPFPTLPINSPTSNSKMVPPAHRLLELANLALASPKSPRLLLLLPPRPASMENLLLLNKQPKVKQLLLPPPLANANLVLLVVEVPLLVNLPRLSVGFPNSFRSIAVHHILTSSSLSVFVGNLPFSVTNESLAATFEGCKVKTATVVTRKFGQAAGRSKGFAFVDFESEQDQQRALNEYQGKELEGRALSLKVAIEADQQQQQQQEGGEVATGTEEQGQEGDAKDGDNEPEATIVAS